MGVLICSLRFLKLARHYGRDLCESGKQLSSMLFMHTTDMPTGRLTAIHIMSHTQHLRVVRVVVRLFTGTQLHIRHNMSTDNRHFMAFLLFPDSKDKIRVTMMYDVFTIHEMIKKMYYLKEIPNLCIT